MATSPIYGWAEPDNTDLVRNGALAIRTLGNAIDTTMATMTPKSTYTAKGSIAAATAASTPANLSVGANGTTLTADSTQATGLGWVATPAASNPILNSAMSVWQRGTSAALGASGVYFADRWQAYRSSAGSTGSRQLTNDTTNLPNIQYCARIARDSGNAATQSIILSQSLETVNSIPFAGKTINFSFYARAGANFSAASSQITAQLLTGTGTDQNAMMTGYTGNAATINQTPTLTTTWQRFSYSATIPAATTEMAPYFTFVPTGTAGANDYYEITGVQIDIGSVALPFRTAGVTYQQELAACQRYYQVNTRNDTFGVGMCPSATSSTAAQSLFFEMRVAPTIVVAATGSTAGTISFLNSTGAYPATMGSIAAASITKNGFILVGTGYTAGFTAGNASFLYASGSTEVWKASAEL